MPTNPICKEEPYDYEALRGLYDATREGEEFFVKSTYRSWFLKPSPQVRKYWFSGEEGPETILGDLTI